MTREIGAQPMEGSTSIVHKFYVVKFLETPNVDIDEYVCVPDSWVIVLLRGCWERRVQVAYPSGESRETTSDRVKREEGPWDEWSLYCAVVTYKTNSYDSARAWIRVNGLNLLSALDYVDIANTEVLDSTSSSGPNGFSNRSSPSSPDVSNLRMQIIDEVSYDNNQNCQNHHSKIPANSNDINGYATFTVSQEIPDASNQSCRYASSGKQLLSSVIQAKQDGMNNSMIDSVAAPPSKSPSISTKQSHLQLPLPNGIINGRNKENVSLAIQLQVIQDRIQNKEKDEVVNKKGYSQKMRNKKRRPSVTNLAFKYYVVQFKDLPDPKMRINNYVCVRNSWISSGLADIEVDNVPDINFGVKVAYPADPREIPLDFRKLPDEPLKEWKSYRAVVKHITGSYYAAKYWIEQKIGVTHAPVKNDATDMGGNPPPAALENQQQNVPSSDLEKFGIALAHCISQPGLTVKIIRSNNKEPAASAIVDGMKRPKRVEEGRPVVYNLASVANTPPIAYETLHTQNRSCLGKPTKLIQAHDLKTQSNMSALRTHSQQIPPQTQAYMNQRDFYRSVDNNRWATQNIYPYSIHKLPGYPHMWPNGSNHIPAYHGYTYRNAQPNPVNNICDTNHINGHNSAYHRSRIAQSTPDNPHLFDPREHPQYRPLTYNNSSSRRLLCNGNPSKMSGNINDLVNRLKIALLEELSTRRLRPPEHCYQRAY